MTSLAHQEAFYPQIVGRLDQRYANQRFMGVGLLKHFKGYS